VTVEDADKTIEEVIRAGGEPVKAKERFLNMGYVAYVKDTEGNVVGTRQPLRNLK